jgi:hypothetical protein
MLSKQLVGSALALVLLAACGPGRTQAVHYPGAPLAFDRAGSDPKAVAIADKVIAAAGGAAAWNGVKQLRWSENVAMDGKVTLDFEEAWDRWNGRHYGRLHRDTADVVVMRSLYEEGGGAYAGKKVLHKLTGDDEATATTEGKKRWEFDTAGLTMPFLLEEPGTKLAYGGEVPGEEGKPPLDDVTVTFDAKDTNRTTTYHVLVNRDSNMIERLELLKAGQPDTQRIGYKLDKWTTVKGMKFPGELDNIGLKGEVITFKDVATGDPDDSLYVPMVQ